MKSTLSKSEAKEKIEKFFNNLDNKSAKEIKKIKRLAMHHHVSLNVYKKNYCGKCFSVFNSINSEIRIKGGFKIVKCKKCGRINRFKLKT